MKHKEYIQALKEKKLKALAISEQKSSDYTQNDPFDNFKLSELTGVTVEQGILVRIGDKYSRICSLLNSNREQKVLDESIQDTLSDMSNYCDILAVYLDNKKL
jgi:hypothetical protein